MIAKRSALSWLAAAATAIALPAVAGNAQLVILNTNAPGVGFNDPTPAVPVGGNPGMTLGEQRLYAFAWAASKWGEELNSNVPIVIDAAMVPQFCTATQAVLGSAGPRWVDADFPGAEPGYFYHGALVNKLAGEDRNPGVAPIRARFNSNLGKPDCLPGAPFYLGVDNRAGALIDLPSVLLHEFGHGLGFSTVTSNSTGAFLAGIYPSIYDKYAYDNALGTTWDTMTDAQRKASAISGRNLAWNGTHVMRAASQVLSGTPQLKVLSPTEAVATYPVGTATFGAVLEGTGLTGQLMQVVDQANGQGLACAPLSADNARAVKNRVALVDRGTCGFAVKAKNVQDAGAVGVVVADNAPGPLVGMSGADPNVTIPAVRVTLAVGNTLKASISMAERTSGLVARIGTDKEPLMGVDAGGRVLLYTPLALAPGSSVSHWDTSAYRNQLMEPFINADLPHGLAPPVDLSVPMLKDLGW